MIKKIIALAGYPGAGKTTARTTDPGLCFLPYLDIADIYAEYPNIQSKVAFAELLNRLVIMIGEARHDAIVIEAMCVSWQRLWLEVIARANDIQVEYREIHTDLLVCIERVKEQFEAELRSAQNEKERSRITRRHIARLSILQRDLPQ